MEAERQIHLQSWHLRISKKVTHTLQYALSERRREGTVKIKARGEREKHLLGFPSASMVVLDLCCLLPDLGNAKRHSCP